MGLILGFYYTTPVPNMANDGLPTFMDMDVLDFDGLLSIVSVAL